MSVPVYCETCKEPFSARQAEVNRGNARYCSRTCSGGWKRPAKPANCTCSTCGNEFYRSPSKIANSKSGHLFCNRACKEQAQRLGGIKEIQPTHYGTGAGDYREIARRHYEEKCFRCGYDTYPILHVHHLDGNHSNNVPENLRWACPNCHDELHFIDGSGRWGKKS